MARPYPETARGNARKLRRDGTDPEAIIWSFVRNRQLNGFKFRRQVPIGPYIVDFVCQERRLVVELDGWQHADDLRDVERDMFLQGVGYRVLRFWNQEVFADRSAVLEHIVAVLEGRA